MQKANNEISKNQTLFSVKALEALLNPDKELTDLNNTYDTLKKHCSLKIDSGSFASAKKDCKKMAQTVVSMYTVVSEEKSSLLEDVSQLAATILSSSQAQQNVANKKLFERVSVFCSNDDN